MQREAKKILGRLVGERIEPAAFPLSATCTRVPVLEDHHYPEQWSTLHSNWRGAVIYGQLRTVAPDQHCVIPIPVAILSGTQFPGEREKAREMGADFYDVKPSTFEELVKIVRRYASTCPSASVPASFCLAA